MDVAPSCSSQVHLALPFRASAVEGCVPCPHCDLVADCASRAPPRRVLLLFIEMIHGARKMPRASPFNDGLWQQCGAMRSWCPPGGGWWVVARPGLGLEGTADILEYILPELLLPRLEIAMLGFIRKCTTTSPEERGKTLALWPTKMLVSLCVAILVVADSAAQGTDNPGSMMQPSMKDPDIASLAQHAGTLGSSSADADGWLIGAAGAVPTPNIQSLLGEGVDSSPLKPGMQISLQGGSGGFCRGVHVSGCHASGHTSGDHKETFKVLDAGDGRIALKSGKALCTSKGGLQRPCTVEDIPMQSKFEVIDQGAGKLALKGADGKFCSDTAGGIRCTSTTISAKEEFTFTIQGHAEAREDRKRGKDGHKLTGGTHTCPSLDGFPTHLEKFLAQQARNGEIALGETTSLRTPSMPAAAIAVGKDFVCGLVDFLLLCAGQRKCMTKECGPGQGCKNLLGQTQRNAECYERAKQGLLTPPAPAFDCPARRETNKKLDLWNKPWEVNSNKSSKFLEVAAGDDHICGRTFDSTVQCFSVYPSDYECPYKHEECLCERIPLHPSTKNARKRQKKCSKKGLEFGVKAKEKRLRFKDIEQQISVTKVVAAGEITCLRQSSGRIRCFGPNEIGDRIVPARWSHGVVDIFIHQSRQSQRKSGKTIVCTIMTGGISDCVKFSLEFKKNKFEHQSEEVIFFNQTEAVNSLALAHDGSQFIACGTDDATKQISCRNEHHSDAIGIPPKSHRFKGGFQAIVASSTFAKIYGLKEAWKAEAWFCALSTDGATVCWGTRTCSAWPTDEDQKGTKKYMAKVNEGPGNAYDCYGGHASDQLQKGGKFATQVLPTQELFNACREDSQLCSGSLAMGIAQSYAHKSYAPSVLVCTTTGIDARLQCKTLAHPPVEWLTRNVTARYVQSGLETTEADGVPVLAKTSFALATHCKTTCLASSALNSWACARPSTAFTACRDEKKLTILDPLVRAGTCTDKSRDACPYCNPRHCCDNLYNKSTGYATFNNNTHSTKVFFHTVSADSLQDSVGVCLEATDTCLPRCVESTNRPNSTATLRCDKGCNVFVHGSIQSRHSSKQMMSICTARKHVTCETNNKQLNGTGTETCHVERMTACKAQCPFEPETGPKWWAIGPTCVLKALMAQSESEKKYLEATCSLHRHTIEDMRNKCLLNRASANDKSHAMYPGCDLKSCGNIARTF